MKRSAHNVECPRCSASAGVYCCRSDGSPMMGYHHARHIAAGTFFVRRRR